MRRRNKYFLSFFIIYEVDFNFLTYYFEKISYKIKL